MGKLSFSRHWPAARNGSPTCTSYSQRETVDNRSRRILGVSSRMATYILSGIVFWNFAILILCITVSAAQGVNRWEFAGDMWYNRIAQAKKAGIVFLWCTLPFVALLISVFDLVRRNTLTVRRAAISAGAGATLFFLAFLLWGDCSYLSGWYNVDAAEGLYPVCYHDPSWDYFSGKWHNPIAIIFVLPWFALGAALTYGSLMIVSILSIRRQRKAAAAMTVKRKSLSLVESGKPSSEYSQYGLSSIGEETLPSRPRSTVPSRELSVANYSTRPPTYMSSGEDSLLTVPEKDGKSVKGSRGSVGYA